MDFGQARNTTAWHPEPNFRGTYGLLSSCLVTMGLCVWTAVHLNVPEPEIEGTKYYLFPPQTWRKVKWLLIGLFAPEVVAWTAFMQRREAKEFHRRMTALLGEDQVTRKRRCLAMRGSKAKTGGQGIPDEEQQELGEGCQAEPQNSASGSSTRSRRRNPWTMTHSYYATMGGFAFSNESPLGDWVTLDGWKRLTLTSLGMLELVKHKPELLPDLSVADIQDKSKANGLAKTIVIMQASWFMVQCLSRMGTGMTISVLELNTFAHALCALVAYAMWWRKPLDISQPTLIKGPGTDQVCGSLYRRSLPWWRSIHGGVRAKAFHESGDKLYAKVMIQNPGRPEGPITSGYEWSVQPSSKDGEPFRVVASAPSGFYKPLDCLGPSGQKSSNVMLPPGIVSPSDDGAIFRLYYGQTVYGIGISSGGAFHSNVLHNVWLGRGRRRTVGVFVELSPAEVLLYQLGSERVMPGPGCDLPVIHRIKNSLTDATCAVNTATTMTVGVFIAGTIYGGLHLVAWSPPVRSNAETTIWRFSASFIIIFGCGYWLIGMLRTRWIESRSKKLRGYSSLLKWLEDLDAVLHLKWIHNVAVLAVIMIYILARIYLVVECFVGVPRLPDSVFETPAWAQYFPHFG